MSSNRKNNVVLVIPVFSDHPSKNELISITKTVQILQNRILRILHPECLDISAFKSVVPTRINSENTIEFVSFPAIHFAGIRMYNTWFLTSGFYENFINFEFLCFIQTHAFLFSDDLDHWLDQYWDYIGAPWFEGWDKGDYEKIISAGNGGFSLRRINPIIHVLNSKKKLYGHKQSIIKLMKKNRGRSLYLTGI